MQYFLKYCVNNLMLNQGKRKCIKFVTANANSNCTEITIKDEEVHFVDRTVFLARTRFVNCSGGLT